MYKRVHLSFRFMVRHTIALLLVLLLSCRETQPVKEVIAEDSSVADSFVVIYNSKQEISQTVPISDSLFFSFNRDGYSLTKYELSGSNVYKMTDKVIYYNAPEPLLSFFIDSTGEPNFISDENTWLKIDSEDNFYVYDTIRLDMKYLQNRFRIFSIRRRPVLLIGERIFFSPIWVELEDYDTYLKEPCLVSVSLDRQDTQRHREFFDKPGFFKIYPNPRISYCFNGKEIVMLYPNSDTLYSYNIATGQYSKKAIHNYFYSQPEPADQRLRWDEVYTIKYKLHNFSYEAIWYNKNTGHYVLMYVMPVDKKIKVPTYDDQPAHALVLNERFEPLQYILFKERYYNNNAMQTTKGLAMPVHSKLQKQIDHDIPIRYYVYDF